MNLEYYNFVFYYKTRKQYRLHFPLVHFLYSGFQEGKDIVTKDIATYRLNWPRANLVKNSYAMVSII